FESVRRDSFRIPATPVIAFCFSQLRQGNVFQSHVNQETGQRGPELLDMREIIRVQKFGANQLFQGVAQISIGDHYSGRDLFQALMRMASAFTLYTENCVPFLQISFPKTPNQNAPASLLVPLRQFVHKNLGPSTRIVVAKEISKPKH